MKKSNPNKQIQLFLIYGLIGILITIYALVINSYLEMQSHDNIRINCAGRLRMLTQKMTKDILMYRDGTLSKQPVLDSARLFNESIHAITYGGTFPLDINRTITAMVPVMDDGDSLDHLKLVVQEWEPFRNATTHFLELKNSDSLDYILTRNEHLMQTVDRAVLAIQGHAESDRNDLGLIILSAIVLVIASVTSLLFRQLWKNQRTRERLEEIESLLPICAGCKKIRTDDTRPGEPRSWTSIEEYLRDHKNMIFTHSLCPECMVRYSPGNSGVGRAGDDR